MIQGTLRLEFVGKFKKVSHIYYNVLHTCNEHVQVASPFRHFLAIELAVRLQSTV